MTDQSTSLTWLDDFRRDRGDALGATAKRARRPSANRAGLWGGSPPPWPGTRRCCGFSTDAGPGGWLAGEGQTEGEADCGAEW